MFLRVIRLAAWWPALVAAQRAVMFSLFVLITLWVAVAYEIHREDQEALHHAQVTLTNLNRAFAEHTAKTIQGADQVARFVRAQYLEKGDHLDIASFLRHQNLIDTDYQLVSIIDAQGWLAYASKPFERLDLHDREHFRVHTYGNEDRLFISKPVLGRVSGKWSIQVSRRITDPRTHVFKGVVVVSLSPDYVASFFQGVNLGPYGVMAMVGMEGGIRARAPPIDLGKMTAGLDVPTAAQTPGMSMMALMTYPEGMTRSVSQIDGVERLWAFQRLKAYPTVVITGMGVTDIDVDTKARAWVYKMVAGLLSVVLAGFLFSLILSARRQGDIVAQLRQSQQQAQTANEMKTRLLASVSHELRTPLNGILGYAELIRDGTTPEETQEFSEIIFHSAQHLGGLVNGLLDMARIESGRMILRVEEVDILACVRQIYGVHALQASETSIAFVLDLPPHVDATAWHLRTDAIRVTQILTNILSNAFKFTTKGEITLSMRRQDPRCVVLRVQDSGIGMSQQHLSQVFTRFHAMTRDPDEPIHAQQGAGIGLPLAKELAGLLHSHLEIESRLGRGTIVTLRLSDMRAVQQPR
ncbi:MAG: ATP-binding protein [Leptothrix ochracea]|uniref:sensor histidine kinase n=1 Tax=Leptothrix ochracea TaxID=735331 RepID=UPI0034E2F8FB